MPAHGEVRAVDSPAVGQDVCQSAFCAELTIALDERRVSLLTAGALVWTNLLEVLARGRLGSQIVGVQERTGLAGLADALTIEFARDVCGAFELSRISVGAPLVLLLVPHALTLAVGRAAGPVEAAHAAHMALVAVLHAVLYGDALLGLLGGTLDLAVLAAAEVARVAVGDAVAVGRGLGRELGSKGGHVGVGERRRGIVGWACRVLRRREEGLGRRRLGLAFGGHGASESWPCGAGRGCSSVREGDVVGALRAVEDRTWSWAAERWPWPSMFAYCDRTKAGAGSVAGAGNGAAHGALESSAAMRLRRIRTAMMRAVWQCRQLQDIRPPGLSRGGQRLPARESRKQAVSTHTHASPAPLQLSLAMSSCLTALQRLPHAPCVPVRCPARHAPAGPGCRACPLMMMLVRTAALSCPVLPVHPHRDRDLAPGAWRRLAGRVPATLLPENVRPALHRVLPAALRKLPGRLWYSTTGTAPSPVHLISLLQHRRSCTQFPSPAHMPHLPMSLLRPVPCSLSLPVYRADSPRTPALMTTCMRMFLRDITPCLLIYLLLSPVNLPSHFHRKGETQTSSYNACKESSTYGGAQDKGDEKSGSLTDVLILYFEHPSRAHSPKSQQHGVAQSS